MCTLTRAGRASLYLPDARLSLSLLERPSLTRRGNINEQAIERRSACGHAEKKKKSGHLNFLLSRRCGARRARFNYRFTCRANIKVRTPARSMHVYIYRMPSQTVIIIAARGESLLSARTWWRDSCASAFFFSSRLCRLGSIVRPKCLINFTRRSRHGSRREGQKLIWLQNFTDDVDVYIYIGETGAS